VWIKWKTEKTKNYHTVRTVLNSNRKIVILLDWFLILRSFTNISADKLHWLGTSGNLTDSLDFSTLQITHKIHTMPIKINCICSLCEIGQKSSYKAHIYKIHDSKSRTNKLYIYCPNTYIVNLCVTYLRDRPFNLKGGVMVFWFVQKKNFGQHES
jgi:hypothetical protein